jgi:TPR repeat protein
MTRSLLSILSFLALVCSYAAVQAQTALSPEMQKILVKAEAGDAQAQTALGNRMQAEKRYPEALSWYEKAAALGHAPAIYYLGYLYETGSGTKQDRKKALDLYSKSANLGQPEAMWHLAQMYDAGEAVKRDALQHCVWSLRANKYVDMENQYLLAVLGRKIAILERKMPKNQLEKCRKQAQAWSPVNQAAKSKK